MSEYSPFFPFTVDQLYHCIKQFGSPFWLYDAKTITSRIAQLKDFDVIRYAQKACSNIHILQLMRQQGVMIDAVSLGEIERALIAGYEPGQSALIFTADLWDEATLDRIIALNIPANIGSIDMLHQLGQRVSGHTVWLRINPGFGHGHHHKTNTGGENSKHGIWHEEIGVALSVIKQYGLALEGVHMHIGSGADYQHLTRTSEAMVACVKAYPMKIKAISAGGGLPIPYHADESSIDVQRYFDTWNTARQQISQLMGVPIKLEIEPGRFLVAEAGQLITQVRATKKMGSKNYILLDAGFNDLMRPALYGSYHRISLLPRHPRALEAPIETIVAGPLCESGDVFTQQIDGTLRPYLLPPAAVGDYIIFHDTGAYGASMSSYYNTRPLIAEVIWKNSKPMLIRRRQTIAELISLELLYKDI